MHKKWFIPVGTATTSRKKSAIQHALAGTMEERHLNYVLMKYRNALTYPVQNFVLEHYGPGKIIGFEVREFVEDCTKDAFRRINEYDPQYRFRSFLTNKIILPALQSLIRSARHEKEAIVEYVRWKEALRKFERDYRYSLAQEFVRDALLEMKKQEEVKYEVFCMRFFDELSYKEIYQKLKEQYPLSLSSEASVRKIHERAEKKLKHIFRELIRNRQYVDDDLPFNKHIIKKLHAETTKR